MQLYATVIMHSLKTHYLKGEESEGVREKYKKHYG
jgi:hypothetical protein